MAEIERDETGEVDEGAGRQPAEWVLRETQPAQRSQVGQCAHRQVLCEDGSVGETMEEFKVEINRLVVFVSDHRINAESS